MGGSTARIGDPTGRLEGREHLDTEKSTMNLVKIHYQLKKLWSNVEFVGRKYGHEVEWAALRGILNNSAWLCKVPIMEVLKRAGNFIRLGQMLSRDTYVQPPPPVCLAMSDITVPVGSC